MSRFAVTALVLATVLACASSTPAATRVIQGEDAHRGQFPYQVALTRELWLLCGGVIVHERFFLSAAHCFFEAGEQLPEDTFRVFYGSERFLSKGKFTRVKAVHVHENYDHGLQYDLAVVEVSRNFEFSYTAQPVVFGLEAFGEPKEVTLSGWGRTANEQNTAFKLKFTTLNTLPEEQCRESLGDDFYDGAVCLDTTSNAPAGVCFGDYGGPAVFNNTLVGVASYSVAGTCGAGKPDVLVDVGLFAEWVNATLTA